jgi:predicted dehydrogenase
MNTNSSRRHFLQTTGTAIAGISVLPALAQETPRLRIALVGVAHIHTPGFIELIKTRPEVSVKYVWDHDAARAEKRAKQVNAKVAELKQIWDDPEVTAILICSETNRHPELVTAAAKAGKHMFVEKPLGITGAESVAMAKEIEDAKLLFTTGYFMRTDPKHLYLREQVALGTFGKISRVRGSNCHAGSLGGWFDTEWRWMTDRKLSGVGAFGDLGTHKLDILLWMFGPAEAVTAQIASVTGRYGDCDESGEGLIRFKNGIVGTLAAGWVDVADPVQLLISGTEGHALVYDNYLYIKSKKLGLDGVDPFTKLPTAPRAPLHQFLDAASGLPNMPLVTPREAAERVAVMEAMYAGAKDNRWIIP